MNVVYLHEVLCEIFLPSVRFANTVGNVVFVEVAWIRVEDATESANRSIFGISDPVLWNAIVCGIVFSHMPLEAIECCYFSRVFADKAPALIVVRGSC